MRRRSVDTTRPREVLHTGNYAGKYGYLENRQDKQKGDACSSRERPVHSKRVVCLSLAAVSTPRNVERGKRRLKQHGFWNKGCSRSAHLCLRERCNTNDVQRVGQIAATVDQQQSMCGRVLDVWSRTTWTGIGRNPLRKADDAFLHGPSVGVRVVFAGALRGREGRG